MNAFGEADERSDSCKWILSLRRRENCLHLFFAVITDFQRLSALVRKEKDLTYACGDSGVRDLG